MCYLQAFEQVPCSLVSSDECIDAESWTKCEEGCIFCKVRNGDREDWGEIGKRREVRERERVERERNTGHAVLLCCNGTIQELMEMLEVASTVRIWGRYPKSAIFKLL